MIDAGTSVAIRWLVQRDLKAVVTIEDKCFAFTWSAADFLECLRQRNAIGMVATRDERVVGFMVYELRKSELHILNFAVDPELMRTGVGTAMLDKLKEKIRQQRRTVITVGVRESNLAAQLFFRNADFLCIGTVRGFYQQTDEDAYIFRWALPV